MKNAKKKSPIFNFLAYALLGCALTAALLALTFTGGTFAILVTLAAVALLHALIGLGYELYKNYQKPNLTTLEKIGIGLALLNIAIAILGLMIVFPHIGIPLIGVAAIAGIAFVVSTFPPIHHFFKKLFSHPHKELESELLLHIELSSVEKDTKSLRDSIQNLEKRTRTPIAPRTTKSSADANDQEENKDEDSENFNLK
jgi:hypothetical protein